MEGSEGRQRSKTRVQQAQEELVCPICIDFFKQPRSLACQHSFCHECLELLAYSSRASSSEEVVISCPECRVNIILPEDGVQGLPKNFKLERIVEILSPSERAEIQRTTAFKRRRRCLLHTQKYQEYYCNSCKSLACGDCLVEKHMNHNVKRANEILPQHVNALQALIPGAAKALEDGTESLTKLQGHSDSLQKQGERATREIEAYFDNIRKILSKREAELKSEVRGQVEEGQGAIERNQNSLQISVKEIQKCRERLEQMTTTHKNSVDVLAEERQLVSRLESSKEDLEAQRKVADRLRTLSIQPPSLKSPRLEALLKTIAAKSPVPIPRRQRGNGGSPFMKPHLRTGRTDSTLSDGYAITPDFKRTEEAASSDEEEDSPEDPTSFPPTPPLRNQSHDFIVDIVEPTLVHGPRNLSNSFFRNPTEAIYPCGVCCGASNTIVVTDVRNHCFRILTFTGKCLDVVGKEGKSDGMFGEPTAVAVDKEGNLLVCDLSPARVQKFTPQGQFISKLSGRVFRGNPLGEPWGVAVSFDGKILVSDWDKSCIHTYNESGHYTGNFGSTNIETPLKYPAGIAVDKRGRVIVADRGNHSIWIYTPDGSLLSRFGKMGHAPGQLYFPFGVAIDKNGHIYVSESGNHRISVFDSDGKFLRCFGKKGTEPGMFQLPRHMCIDSHGRLLVSDEQNQRLQVFSI